MLASYGSKDPTANFKYAYFVDYSVYLGHKPPKDLVTSLSRTCV
jgi:hypothetical protein